MNKNCCNVAALVELNFEDEKGRTICFDFPIGLDVFIIALVLSQLEEQK